MISLLPSQAPPSRSAKGQLDLSLNIEIQGLTPSMPFRLFPEVIVPEEVRLELQAKESPDRDQLVEVLSQARIHPHQSPPDRLLLTELDDGEAAVISAAMRLGLSAVILDERKARRIASRVYGLEVKGSAGLLVEAKNRGLIESVKPHLEGMIRG